MDMKGISSNLAKVLVFTFLQAGFISKSTAQENYQAVEGSEVTIQGTSTLHDWKSETDKLEGEAEMEFDEGRITTLKNVKIRIPVKSIQSGKNLMDKKTYDALEADNHPFIWFKQSSLKSIDPEKIVITGELQIAGVDRKVELEAAYTLKGSEIVFTGDIPLKMSDYSIDPPTAMMGTIKTGDEIVLTYRGVFSK
jgi:polyisoprenoid-binding protein YceI